MFEQRKFEKLKAQGASLSCITVYLGADAKKESIKGCEKLFKKLFGNYKTTTHGQITISTLGEELPIERSMGDVMDYFVSIKTSETIKFSVNDVVYEI